MADVGHGPQMSAGWDVGVPIHWGGAGKCGTGGDWGIHCSPLENGCAIHDNPSYHGLVVGFGAEAGNAPIQVMVGESRPVYHGDKGG